MTSPKAISFQNIPDLTLLMSAFPGTRGLFFDMDGTLFNTEKYHAEAMIKIGEEYDIKPPYSFDEIHALMIGKADHLVFDIIKYWEGFPKQWTARDFINAKNQHVMEILKAAPSAEYYAPEVASLLKSARAAGLFLALVTSSEKIVTQKLLELAGLSTFFDIVLTRDDCPQHKPDPWPYLEALRQAEMLANEVIIFEDSPVGLSAAHAAGTHVVKVEWY